jgi:hypothetical protein
MMILSLIKVLFEYIEAFKAVISRCDSYEKSLQFRISSPFQAKAGGAETFLRKGAWGN